jgi:single-strand DNA-binding protein
MLYVDKLGEGRWPVPGEGIGSAAAVDGQAWFEAKAQGGWRTKSFQLWSVAMAGSVNKVILVGNLGKDPEIRRTQDGRPIANLSVATSESWRDKATGERKEKTEWHRVVIFNEGLCKVAEQYLKKGAKVYLEGQLQTRKWTDQSGVEKYSTEVVLQGFNSNLTMLDGRSGGAGGSFGDEGGGDFGAGGPSSAPPRRAVTAAATGSRNSDMDDDIPF